jgi:hypothetical protein
MRWAENVARMREKRNVYKDIGGKAKRKEDQDVGAWTILKWR